MLVSIHFYFPHCFALWQASFERLFHCRLFIRIWSENECSVVFQVMVDRMLAQMNMNNHLPAQSGETSTSTFVLARTSKEQSSFRAVQSALRKLHLTIQPVHQTNVLYISSVDDWKRQVNTYLTEANVFSLIGSLKAETANRHVHTVLVQMNDGVATALHTLFRHQAITTTEYERRMSLIHSNQCQISQLYFLPTVQQVTRRSVQFQ